MQEQPDNLFDFLFLFYHKWNGFCFNGVYMVTHSIHSEEETVCLTRFTKSSQNGNLESSQFSNDKYSHGWGKKAPKLSLECLLRRINGLLNFHNVSIWFLKNIQQHNSTLIHGLNCVKLISMVTVNPQEHSVLPNQYYHYVLPHQNVENIFSYKIVFWWSVSITGEQHKLRIILLWDDTDVKSLHARSFRFSIHCLFWICLTLVKCSILPL